MRFIGDTHLHLYPNHEVRKTLSNLVENLHGHDDSAVKLGFLAERHDCNFFTKIKLAEVKCGFTVSDFSHQPATLLLEREGQSCYLFGGRQIVPSERIEILALMTERLYPDGLTAQETVKRILADNGLPVVAWAPGKWFFNRGRVVTELLQQFSPGQLFLGDSLMRPAIWPTPRLMARGEKNGFSVLAGSDPLPFDGEEKQAGRLATIFEGEFDRDHPQDSIHHLLTQGVKLTTAGERQSLFTTLKRLYRNSQAKK